MAEQEETIELDDQQPPQTSEIHTDDAADARINSDLRTLKCDMTISKHMAASVGAGFIPVPLVDFVAISGVQLDLVYRLCKIYDVKFSTEAARGAITSLAAAAVPVFPSTLLSSSLKFIPGIGTAAALFTTPALAAATTYAIGRVFVQHLESGGTLLTFDANKMREHFERALNEGKRMTSRTAKA
jgi:uncharacterized protein (DUF697 family)